MAFQPFRLTSAEAGGGGNFMDAFARGLNPRNASEDLLAKMLSNKIQGVNAKYAEPNTLADLLTKNLTNEYAGKSMPERLRALSLGNEGTSLGNQYNRESMQDRILANQLTNQGKEFENNYANIKNKYADENQQEDLLTKQQENEERNQRSIYYPAKLSEELKKQQLDNQVLGVNATYAEQQKIAEQKTTQLAHEHQTALNKISNSNASVVDKLNASAVLNAQLESKKSELDRQSKEIDAKYAQQLKESEILSAKLNQQKTKTENKYYDEKLMESLKGIKLINRKTGQEINANELKAKMFAKNPKLYLSGIGGKLASLDAYNDTGFGKQKVEEVGIPYDDEKEVSQKEYEKETGDTVNLTNYPYKEKFKKEFPVKKAPQTAITSKPISDSRMEKIRTSMINKEAGIRYSSSTVAKMELDDAKEMYADSPTEENLQKVKDAEDAKYRTIHGKSKQTEAIEQKRAENTNKSLAMRGWQGALPETKRDAIATARGAGVEAIEAEEMLKKGHSLEDTLKNHGWDVNKLGYPEKEYLPTTKGITDFNNRIWAGREMSYIGRYISKNTGEYASTIMGENPKLIWDSLVGANKDKQIKYLTSLSLSPELGNLRLKYTGAANTVSAQKAMMDSSLLKLRNKLPRVPDDVWKGVQDEQEKVLREAFNFSKKNIVSPAKTWIKTKEELGADAEDENAKTRELSKKDMDAFVDYNKKYPNEFDLDKIKEIAKNKKKSVYEIIKILHE